MVINQGILRAVLGFCFCLIVDCGCQSQVTVVTRDHTCEGDVTWDVPACESAWRPHISAVFLGRAVEVRKEDVPILLDGEKALTERLHVTFEVEESYIGVQEKSVIVTSGGDLCGLPFSKGHEYLVYGRRLQNGDIYVSISSGTKWKKEANKDLKYLRGLSTASSGARIYGTVFRYNEPTNPRIKAIRRGTAAVGQKITIRGSQKNYEVAVDAEGKFEIPAIPPGRYTIVLESDETVNIWPPHLPMTFDLVDKACARFNFWIDPFAKADSEVQRRADSLPGKVPHKDDQHK
jgi:hypothetical protein